MPYQPEQSWAHWSPERIRDEQGKRLRRFIREQVVPFSPLYRRLFKENGIDPLSIRSVDDLQKIPFISKEEITMSIISKL